MIGSTWIEFMATSDNSVLSQLMGPVHNEQMTMNDGKGTSNNKFTWFKRESKSKYDLSVFFMIFFIIIVYWMPSNNSNFKRLQLLGDDEKEWYRGNNSWHVITNQRSDTGIHDNKGFYEYFVQLIFA